MQKQLALFLIVPLFLAACGNAGTLPDDSDTASSSSSAASSAAQVSGLPEGNFGFTPSGNFEGAVYVRGYPTIETVQESFCEADCAEYEYVFFNVVETGNDDFRDFLMKNQGNTYAGQSRIGLGCVMENVINYWNDSDELGRKEFTLTSDVSQAILSATDQQPVVLKLTKLPFNAGSGAPACYAHFTTVELADESELSADVSSTPSKQSPDGCMRAGCSGQICADVDEAGDIVTTCEYRAEYACYEGATCERQADGQCGWTITNELQACLQNPPPLQ